MLHIYYYTLLYYYTLHIYYYTYYTYICIYVVAYIIPTCSCWFCNDLPWSLPSFAECRDVITLSIIYFENDLVIWRKSLLPHDVDYLQTSLLLTVKSYPLVFYKCWKKNEIISQISFKFSSHHLQNRGWIICCNPFYRVEKKYGTDGLGQLCDGAFISLAIGQMFFLLSLSYSKWSHSLSCWVPCSREASCQVLWQLW